MGRCAVDGDGVVWSGLVHISATRRPPASPIIQQIMPKAAMTMDTTLAFSFISIFSIAKPEGAARG